MEAGYIKKMHPCGEREREMHPFCVIAIDVHGRSASCMWRRYASTCPNAFCCALEIGRPQKVVWKASSSIHFPPPLDHQPIWWLFLFGILQSKFRFAQFLGISVSIFFWGRLICFVLQKTCCVNLISSLMFLNWYCFVCWCWFNQFSQGGFESRATWVLENAFATNPKQGNSIIKQAAFIHICSNPKQTTLKNSLVCPRKEQSSFAFPWMATIGRSPTLAVFQVWIRTK